MHLLIVLLFTIAAGLTASGVISSIYRMVAREPETRLATCLHYVVLSVAGPVVLFTNRRCAVKSPAQAFSIAAWVAIRVSRSVANRSMPLKIACGSRWASVITSGSSPPVSH